MKKILVIGLLAVLVLSVMATGMVRKFTRDGECGGRNVVAVCQNYGGNDEQFYAQGAPSSVSTTDLYIEASCEGEWECSDYNAKTIRNLQALLRQVARNRFQAERVRGEIRFYQLNTQDVEDGFEIVKPTVTFSDEYTLDLGDVRLELVYFGKGHSLSDILIHIPQERLLVTGAIVYLRGHLPGISERAELKDVHRYIAVLDRFLDENVKIDHVLPSHSPMLTRTDLRYVRDYYRAMLDGIRSAQQQGLTLGQAQERFAVHKRFPHFFQRQSAQWAKAKQDRNIRVLWGLMEAKHQPQTPEGTTR